MDGQFEKIIKFVKQNGEKVIVLKDNAEFVVISLDDYNRLITQGNPISQMSEVQLLDKINRDIALWRQAQKDEKGIEPPFIFDDGPHYESFDEQPEEYIPDDYPFEDLSINHKSVSPEFSRQKDHPSSNENNPLSGTQQTNYEDEQSWQPQEINQDIYNRQDFNFKDENPFSSADMQSHKAQHNFDNPPTSADQAKSQDRQEQQKPHQDRQKKSRVNNFGYVDPLDTSFNQQENQQQSTDTDQDYDDVPPPPDAQSG